MSHLTMESVKSKQTGGPRRTKERYYQMIKSINLLDTLQFKKISDSDIMIVIRYTELLGIRIWHYFPRGKTPKFLTSQDPVCNLIPGQVYFEIPKSSDDLIMELAENLVKQGYKSTRDD